MSKLLDEALLSAFLEASRTGTFGTAAKNLGRSQPLLTHQIQRLEDIVGYQLFIRTPRGVQITLKGVELHSYIRRIVAVSDEAMKHFKVNGRIADRPFRVKLSEDLASKIVLKSMLSSALFSGSFDLEIVGSGRAPVASEFEEGQVDLFLGDLISNLPVEIGPSNRATVRLTWAASPTFDPLRRPLALGLYPLVCSWRQLVAETLDHALINWSLAVESESLSALQTAAGTGSLMIACLPSAIEHGLVRIDHQTFALPEPPEVDIAMYKLQSKRCPPRLDDLATYLWKLVLDQT